MDKSIDYEVIDRWKRRDNVSAMRWNTKWNMKWNETWNDVWLNWFIGSCDGADRVTAFISVSGNKEKIDDFCGSTTPRELMSNSATMSLHFHSTAVSKGARGFKARYAFVSSRLPSLLHLFTQQTRVSYLLMQHCQISVLRRASRLIPCRALSSTTAPSPAMEPSGVPISRDSTRVIPNVTTSSTPRSENASKSHFPTLTSKAWYRKCSIQYYSYQLFISGLINSFVGKLLTRRTFKIQSKIKWNANFLCWKWSNNIIENNEYNFSWLVS